MRQSIFDYRQATEAPGLTQIVKLDWQPLQLPSALDEQPKKVAVDHGSLKSVRSTAYRVGSSRQGVRQQWADFVAEVGRVGVVSRGRLSKKPGSWSLAACPAWAAATHRHHA